VRSLETEETYREPRWMVLGLGLVGLVLAAAIAGVFVLRLQPQITGSVSTVAGEASVVMPSNAALNNFAPVNITVVLGVNSTVKWTNLDTVPHTVVICPVGGGQECPLSAAIASSPVLSQGDTFSYAFTAAGTYHYYCSIHPATMRATVVVVSQASS
jgi:plastocyanin